MAYRKLDDRENYERVVGAYRDAYAKIADLGDGRWRRRERRAAFEDGEAPMKRFRSGLNERDNPRAEALGGSVGRENALGWKLLNQRRPAEAAHVFDIALRAATGRRRQEAAYGRSLALLAAGEAAAAGRAASSADLSQKQRNDVGVQLLERRAWDAYNADRYLEALGWLDRRAAFAPETRDLMQMRAWSLQKLGRLEAAAAIQAQLDQQLSR